MKSRDKGSWRSKKDKKKKLGDWKRKEEDRKKSIDYKKRIRESNKRNRKDYLGRQNKKNKGLNKRD